MRSHIRITDRLWLATMSVANGLPFAVTILLLIMFKRFGLNSSTVTFNIAFACLPWTLRPLCHLLLAKSGWNNDVWLLATELTTIVSLLLIAESVASTLWFQFTMVLLMVIAMSAMLHSVVAESMYKEIAAAATCRQSGRNGSSAAAPHTLTGRTPWLRPRFALCHFAAALFGIGFAAMLAGNLEVVTRNVHYAWSFTFRALAAAYTLLWLFHLVKAWCRKANFSNAEIQNVGSTRELGHAVRLFFGYRSVSIGALFLLLFPLPLGLTLGVGSYFVVDSTHRGGLGLAPQEYALTNGTTGIIGLAVGATVCLWLLRRYRMSRTVVPLSLSVCVPAIAGAVLSRTLPASLAMTNAWMFLSHAAIGMAFTTAIAFLSYYSCGRYRPTFFSTGIALMALSLLLSGLYSGSLQRYYGYRTYFMFALLVSLLSPVAALVLKHFCFRHTD